MNELQRLQEEFSLSENQMEQFERYYQVLIEENKKINLTSITKREEVYMKHFFDSLSLSKLFPFSKDSSLLDVGTGAGFPGIPLKIAFPDLNLVLLDSLQKRVNFLMKVIESCNLSNAKPIHARAEDAARKPEFREMFDVVTARAVARLPILAEYLLPFVKIGGACIAMKGPGAEEEIKEAKKAIQVLGGEVKEVKHLLLPVGMGARYLIWIEKQKRTPKRYPRKAGVPSKQPIS